jgi:hypothetical protein
MRRTYIKPEMRGTLIGLTAILIMLLSALGLQADRPAAQPRAGNDAPYQNWP